MTRQILKWFGIGALTGLVVLSAVADDNSPIEHIELQCRGTKLSPQEQQQALAKVKAALIEKYIVSCGEERQRPLNDKKAELQSDPDKYLSGLTIRSEDFEKKTKVYTLAAQADVNKEAINRLIDQGRLAGSTPAAQNQPYIVLVFVARRQTEVESKGPLVKTTVGSEKKQEVQVGAEGSGASTFERKADSQLSGSSIKRRADQIVYAVENNSLSGIDRTMSKVFVDRGFKTVPAFKLSGTKFKREEFVQDFNTSSKFTDEHENLAFEVCNEKKWLLGYGTLTIGAPRSDDKGHVVVNVIVDGVVLDCRDDAAPRVASIGALQVEQIGADQTQAETEALNLAATKAATVIADQLANNGIR